MTGGTILGFVGMFGWAVSSVAERRELGPHEHGHSTLNIAVEGSRVTLELTSPGMDIVGFEHPAETAEQRAAVEAGKRALADPLALFVPPPAAGCRLAEAEAEVALDAEDHGAGEDHARAEARGNDEEEEGKGHTEFHAEYALDCANPSALGSITFAFFERFPDAEKVEVTLIGERGQRRVEVERARPRLTLGDPS